MKRMQTGGVGGGIKLENGSMDVSAGSNRIYNNTAGGQGADIFLLDGNASIKLPIAANMYHDSSINIDNWYKDDNPRHKPSESGQVVKALQWRSGPLSLVASYKADPVRIEIDANGGKGGSVSQTVQKGHERHPRSAHKGRASVQGLGGQGEGEKLSGRRRRKSQHHRHGEYDAHGCLGSPTFTVTYVLLNGKTRAETADYGQTVTLGEEPRTGYTFVGWKDGEKVYHAGETITVTGDMTLTAEWKKLPSAENLPKTGDESPVLLLGRGAGGFRGGLLHAQTKEINQNQERTCGERHPCPFFERFADFGGRKDGKSADLSALYGCNLGSGRIECI